MSLDSTQSNISNAHVVALVVILAFIAWAVWGNDKYDDLPPQCRELVDIIRQDETLNKGGTEIANGARVALARLGCEEP